MTTVTFRNGLTISDDDNPTTGLKNGGHRLRFVPALVASVQVAAEAKDWANKVNSIVFDNEYSAKEYATGLLTATGGSAKAWATKVGSMVDGFDFSAKDYAVGSLSVGSAKAWAIGGVLPAGNKSAREYADDALAFRNSALNAPGTLATSTTSNSITTGSKTFTIQTGKLFAVGAFVLIASAANVNNYMIGQVTSYNTVTGVLVVNVSTTNGTGTFADWSISLTALAALAGTAQLAANNTFTGVNTFNNTISPIVTSKIGPSTTVQHTFPSTVTAPSDEIVLVNAPQALLNKTLTEPLIETPNIQGLGFATFDTVSAVNITTTDRYSFDDGLSTSGTGVRYDFATDVISVPIKNLTVNTFKQTGIEQSVDATTQNGLPRLSQVNTLIQDATGLIQGRNKIINGDFLINQRDASGSIIQNTTSSYVGPDRFKAINTGATGLVFTQSKSSFNFGSVPKNSIRQTVTTVAANTNNMFIGGIVQDIENGNIQDLTGSPFTVSFIFNTNVTGTFNFSVNFAQSPTGAITHSYVSTFSAVAGTPNKIKITVPQTPNNINSTALANRGLRILIAPQSTGTTFVTSSTNTWIAGEFITSPGTTSWVGTVNNFIEVAELQLERGTVATEFERLPQGLQLLLCQRYYYRSRYPRMTGLAGGTSFVTRLGANHPVRMRSTPTVSINLLTLFGTDGLNIVSSVTANTVNIVGNFSNESIFEVDLSISPANGWLQGYSIISYNNNNAASFVEASAEL
jgi:hypothetical protein